MIQFVQNVKGPQPADKSLGSTKSKSGDDSFSKQLVQAFQKKTDYNQSEQALSLVNDQNGDEESFQNFLGAISGEQTKGFMIPDQKKSVEGEQQSKNTGIGSTFLLNPDQDQEISSGDDKTVLPEQEVKELDNLDNNNISAKSGPGPKGSGTDEMHEKTQSSDDNSSLLSTGELSNDESKVTAEDKSALSGSEKNAAQDNLVSQQVEHSARSMARNNNTNSAEEVKVHQSDTVNKGNTEAGQPNYSLKNLQGVSGPVPDTGDEVTFSDNKKDVASKLHQELEAKNVITGSIDAPDIETQETGNQLNNALKEVKINQNAQKAVELNNPVVTGDVLKEAVEKELKLEKERLPLNDEVKDSLSSGNRRTTTAENPLKFGNNYQGSLNQDEGAEQFMPKSSNEPKDTESLFLKNSQAKTEINETVAGRMQQPVMAQAPEPRAFVNRMLQVVRQELQNTQLNAQGWKVHQFSFDDGSKVQMGIRQIEGMLQLQLGSGNTEMNRLIQQNAAEIREYLEKEMGLDVDLQFNLKDSGSHFLDPGSNQQTKQHSKSFRENGVFEKGMEEITNDKLIIRNFGFNNNEWTA
ncbi:MAG: hypothetical protein WD491_06505 [Balneolales bacterium]